MRYGNVAWLPALLLGIGSIAAVGGRAQQSLPLRAPLDTSIPARLFDFEGTDLTVSEEERRVAGMSDYLMRVYSASGDERDLTAAAFSVYVGYYESQTQGRSIHSPKNCLPGAGWDALTSRPATIETPSGAITVNRYLLQRGDQKALVLYWYQGRGRVEANEYRVKWDLLRDAALRRRSDEALVRVLVPVVDTEKRAFDLAARVAGRIAPAVEEALPD